MSVLQVGRKHNLKRIKSDVLLIKATDESKHKGVLKKSTKMSHVRRFVESFK